MTKYKEYQINCRRTRDSVFIKRDENRGLVKEIDCVYYRQYLPDEEKTCGKAWFPWTKNCIQLERKYKKVKGEKYCKGDCKCKSQLPSVDKERMKKYNEGLDKK